MSTATLVDTARLNLLLNELRLPTIKVLWPQFAEQSDKEGWPAARFLATIAEHEIAERGRRRIERHLVEARLPPGKTFDNFDFEAVPMISKAQVSALAAGDGWLGKGANLLLFGPPGGGKSHLAAAIGLALIDNGWRVLFTRTTDLVQKLQVARRELSLEAAVNRLDRFDLLILDDLAYVTKDQAETSVLFELISARYERRSMLITANQPFGERNKVFPDPAMTALWTSTYVAVLVAVIAMVIGFATAFAVNRFSFSGKALLQALAFSPLIVPSVVLGIGLLQLFAWLNLTQTIYPLLLGHLVLAVPYVVRTILASLALHGGSLLIVYGHQIGPYSSQI